MTAILLRAKYINTIYESSPMTTSKHGQVPGVAAPSLYRFHQK